MLFSLSFLCSDCVVFTLSFAVKPSLVAAGTMTERNTIILRAAELVA